MHARLKTTILNVLKISESVALSEARASIAKAARSCVRAQLEVKAPDLYIVHRCLQTPYRQMRHAGQADDETKTVSDEMLAILKSCMIATGPKVDFLYAWIAPKARLLKAGDQMSGHGL